MSKSINAAVAGAAMIAALAAGAVPMTASAAPLQVNGVTNCDAPGGRQRAGAMIGALVGGLAGSQVSKNERTLGAVAGAGLGAAAGSYIGCNQQRARYNSAAANSYRAASNLRIRSGPSTQYAQVGSLSAGQSVQVDAAQGDWVRLAGGGWVNGRYLSAY